MIASRAYFQQVAQLASSCPNANTGKLPGQPEVSPKENVSAVSTRGGNVGNMT